MHQVADADRNLQPLQLGRRDLNLRMLEQVPGLDMWYTLEGSYTKKTAIYGARYVQREQRALAKAKVLSARGQLADMGRNPDCVTDTRKSPQSTQLSSQRYNEACKNSTIRLHN